MSAFDIISDAVAVIMHQAPDVALEQLRNLPRNMQSHIAVREAVARCEDALDAIAEDKHREAFYRINDEAEYFAEQLREEMEDR